MDNALGHWLFHLLSIYDGNIFWRCVYSSACGEMPGEFSRRRLRGIAEREMETQRKSEPSSSVVLDRRGEADEHWWRSRAYELQASTQKRRCLTIDASSGSGQAAGHLLAQ